MNSGDARTNFGAFRSMQRPRMVQRLKVDGGGGASRLGRREVDDETNRHEGGKRKRGPPVLFIR